jgi:hypothetical protein
MSKKKGRGPPKKASTGQSKRRARERAERENIPSSDAAALSLGEVSPFDAATHGSDMAHATGN